MRRAVSLLMFASVWLLGGSALADADFRYEGCTDLGGGVYGHDYVLDNTFGTAPVYDVETDFHYYYGWGDVHTPENWYCYKGPMSRFETDQAPCNVGYEQGGFRIEAGTPTVEYGYFSITDLNHEIICEGQTQWPLPEPATASLLALGALALVRRRRR